jgi:hypothetical protein
MTGPILREVDLGCLYKEKNLINFFKLTFIVFKMAQCKVVQRQLVQRQLVQRQLVQWQLVQRQVVLWQLVSYGNSSHELGRL